MVRNKNGKINWAAIGAVVSALILFIAIAGIIWAGSETNTIARQAHRFTTINYDLPSKVEENRKDIEENKKEIKEFRESIRKLDRIQTRQEALTDRLDEIVRRLPDK